MSFLNQLFLIYRELRNRIRNELSRDIHKTQLIPTEHKYYHGHSLESLSSTQSAYLSPFVLGP